MRVLEIGGEADLLEEAFGAEDGGEFGAEDFDRDLAIVLAVAGEVDRGHAARAELAFDEIVRGEGFG